MTKPTKTNRGNLKNGYGQEELKKVQILFHDTDKRHADFLIRLQYDGFGKSEFLRAMIGGYLDKNEHILAFVEEMKKGKKVGARKRDRVRRQNKQEAAAKKLFSLDKQEVENIFDILEEHLPKI